MTLHGYVNPSNAFEITISTRTMEILNQIGYIWILDISFPKSQFIFLAVPIGAFSN